MLPVLYARVPLKLLGEALLASNAQAIHDTGNN